MEWCLRRLRHTALITGTHGPLAGISFLEGAQEVRLDSHLKVTSISAVTTNQCNSITENTTNRLEQRKIVNP